MNSSQDKLSMTLIVAAILAMVAVVVLTIFEVSTEVMERLNQNSFYASADTTAECKSPREHVTQCFGFTQTDKNIGPVEVTWLCKDGFRATINYSQNICVYRNEPIID